MNCSLLVHEFLISVHSFFIFLRGLVYNLFMTSSWFGNNFFNELFIVHYSLFMPCLVHDFFMTCSRLVQDLFITCSQSIHMFLMTCSWLLMICSDLLMTYLWLDICTWLTTCSSIIAKLSFNFNFNLVKSWDYFHFQLVIL